MLLKNVSLVITLGLLAVLTTSCGKRDNSKRENRALTGDSALTATTPTAQQQQQQAQQVAQAQNIKVSWEEAAYPSTDSLGNLLVTTAFSYNGAYFQVTTKHQVINSSSVTPAAQTWDLKRDGMSVVTQAGCSDSSCSTYAITYNFMKNGQEALQELVWIDFAGEQAPRLHSARPGQFWTLNAWYNFASDINNFESTPSTTN